jgi:hypothetical protein
MKRPTKEVSGKCIASSFIEQVQVGASQTKALARYALAGSSQASPYFA